MYNRYIGNTGKYYRVEDDPRNLNSRNQRRGAGNPPPRQNKETSPLKDNKPPAKFSEGGGISSLLGGGINSLLGGGKFDTGDLMLLALLFFLYKESGDEELLILMIVLAAMLFDVGSLFDRFFK